MKRLAILGGGQLAMMLGEAANRLGVPARALASSRIADSAALAECFSTADVVTLENEFVDTDLLEKAQADHPGVEILPPIKAIKDSRDKLRQKRIFEELGIPTALFEVCGGAGDPEKWLDSMSGRFKSGAMLKWSRWGYDGKGNHPLRDARDRATAVAFCREGISRGAEIYAEEWIPWQTELAMAATRDRAGEIVFFPLVISTQEKSVCREVRGPATALGIPEADEIRAREIVRKLGDRLEMIGTFAVEFFVTADGSLLANEMAPRVHNTAHYSRHSGLVSQFENHVRAVTGLKLRDPGSLPFVGMRNLLGPGDILATPIDAEFALTFFSKVMEGIEATWYFKDTVQPFRKMGHLTAVAKSSIELESRMNAMKLLEAEFWKKFREGAGHE